MDNFDRIVQLEGADYIIGGTTRINYGVSNRLYAKSQTSREILSATISQNYYTDARAAQYDRQFQSSFTSGSAPTHYWPVALQLRGAPTDRIQGEFRTEWDPTRTRDPRRWPPTAASARRTGCRRTAGWSQRRFIPTLPRFNNEAS